MEYKDEDQDGDGQGQRWRCMPMNGYEDGDEDGQRWMWTEIGMWTEMRAGMTIGWR